MQGVNDVFAGMSSTDFDETNATIGMPVARSVPVPHFLCHLLVRSVWEVLIHPVECTTPLKRRLLLHS